MLERKGTGSVLACELMGEPSRSPAGMVPAELDHPELGSGRRSVGQLVGRLERSTRPAIPRSR
jgi:hypothetical protein